MTTHKTFKSRVRARMAKTGESYTTARRHLLARVEDAAAAPTAPAVPEAPEAAAGPVAMTERLSDPVLRERTGRGWSEWFALLDAWGATDHNHTEIARWLVTEHAVDGWWAQSITVGYEQARGLRVPGQQSGGGFVAGVTRTVAATPERVFEAFTDEAALRNWLGEAKFRVRTATAPRSLRADWIADGTRIVVGLIPKGETRTVVSVVHEKLVDGQAVAELKTYWRERLTALRQLLES